MIRLDIQEYCGSCCDFEPDVTKPIREIAKYYDTEGMRSITLQSDTIVRCTHAKRCESIRRYLKQQMGADKSSEKGN